ncbi:hypothetical protein [Dokdonella sp.]|uniref:hypothetical protein n=1 Tax=Dokdonella sp. TaxID=2291710 RepID=UPI001B218DA9|nr:hypothetical protein [Dokdonella sp.]MBO9663347.1 hypothetical protein [Dokdonella sp.]
MAGIRRALKWSGGLLLCLILGAALAVFALFRTFYPTPPKADYPPASDVATRQRQDLDYFRHYLELNRSYTPQARAQAEALREEDLAKAGSFSPAAFDLAVARMVALSDNGHSRIHPGGQSRRHARLPCRFYRFADGYYVLRARPACAELLGAKLTRLDGRPIDDVAQRMYEYFGGPRNHYDQFAVPFFLESPPLLNAAGLAESPERLTLRATLRDGSEREWTIAADPPDADAPRAYSDSYLSPQRLESEPADWTALLPADAALPLFLRDYATPFQSGPLADPAVYYAQLRSNDDEPGHPIGEFLARVEREILAGRPRVIVLDLRFDQGGNFTKTASFMKRLPTLSDSIERVYVLTGAWTFSAGNVSLALLKEHGAGKVRVFGEPVGDRVRIWAEGGTLELPNSKVAIGYATGLHDYAKSCFGESGCFWIMWLYPTHVESFDPDVRVDYTFDDYVRLRDPVMEAVLADARKRD